MHAIGSMLRRLTGGAEAMGHLTGGGPTSPHGEWNRQRDRSSRRSWRNRRNRRSWRNRRNWDAHRAHRARRARARRERRGAVAPL